VSKDSAATAISETVSSPVIGFPLNHIEIAKPENQESPVYQWAMSRVRDEYSRLATWNEGHKTTPPEYRLCEQMKFINEQ
jgi:hypothetical protein